MLLSAKLATQKTLLFHWEIEIFGRPQNLWLVNMQQGKVLAQQIGQTIDCKAADCVKDVSRHQRDKNR